MFDDRLDHKSEEEKKLRLYIYLELTFEGMSPPNGLVEIDIRCPKERSSHLSITYPHTGSPKRGMRLFDELQQVQNFCSIRNSLCKFRRLHNKSVFNVSLSNDDNR